MLYDRVALLTSYPKLNPTKKSVHRIVSKVAGACEWFFPQLSWQGTQQFLLSLSRFRPTLAIVINDAEPAAQWMIQLVARECPLVLVENGLLPQKNHIIFNCFGTGLSYQGRPHAGSAKAAECDEYIESYRTSIGFRRSCVDKIKREQKVLFAGQIWWDSANYRYRSSFLEIEHSNQRDLDFVANCHPGERLVFCPHPLDSSTIKLPQHLSHISVSRFQTHQELQSAKAIYAHSSTVLVESSALGVPARALAKPLGQPSEESIFGLPVKSMHNGSLRSVDFLDILCSQCHTLRETPEGVDFSIRFALRQVDVDDMSQDKLRFKNDIVGEQ
ncbi:hypothetical protein [Gilvimarinus algae]|uniref:Glycosyltransferase n=1 Tax=Gilvimarinus algae TaxID=3058037 RepID=A0ABT8TGN9_9GAMM|nr:hypothetical protein [Gilvimarinus sp. SDUM040014]MDO3383254.1 hypothetical protein [Gilvimarinus sp. SDUM040014]